MSMPPRNTSGLPVYSLSCSLLPSDLYHTSGSRWASTGKATKSPKWTKKIETGWWRVTECRVWSNTTSRTCVCSIPARRSTSAWCWWENRRRWSKSSRMIGRDIWKIGNRLQAVISRPTVYSSFQRKMSKCSLRLSLAQHLHPRRVWRARSIQVDSTDLRLRSSHQSAGLARESLTSLGLKTLLRRSRLRFHLISLRAMRTILKIRYWTI